MSNIFQLNNNKTGTMSVFIVNLGHISHLCYVSSINFEQVLPQSLLIRATRMHTFTIFKVADVSSEL